MDAYQLASLIVQQKTPSDPNQSFCPMFIMVQFVLHGNSELSEEDDGNHDSETSKQTQESCFDDKRSDERNICREDVEMVMEKLGLFSSSEGEELTEWMGSDEISQLFDEKEPSLEEVKEAFNVFDHNSDGFVDASELQRVFCKLGLKEGLDLGKCRKIIRTFDENGDGRIDFNEFVRFMENTFC
ncbi:hypothetical protein OIU85_007597 [Salix viminalis]|uniref:EF-hand domain-containing protein n=1 Tax=Salix viminalis TaxID=40686 RepID=A0A9Q0P9H4_SALVM|nr:hypothetical protein OIU85_007597 [Salix viminalis]